MAVEADLGISDKVEAELVDCTPPEPQPVAVSPQAAPDVSPTATARDATLAQTGADPPPQGV